MRSLSASTTRPAEQRTRKTGTVAVAIALTALVSVVAVASREPLLGTTGPPGETRQASEDAVVSPPAPDFPVPGALPPEVFVIDAEESSGTPAWLPWTLAWRASSPRPCCSAATSECGAVDEAVVVEARARQRDPGRLFPRGRPARTKRSSRGVPSRRRWNHCATPQTRARR